MDPTQSNDVTVEESKAALGSSTRILQDLLREHHAQSDMTQEEELPEMPEMEMEPTTEEPMEPDPEMEIEEEVEPEKPEIDVEQLKKDLTSEFTTTMKEEMAKLRKEIMDALHD